MVGPKRAEITGRWRNLLCITHKLLLWSNKGGWYGKGI